MTVQPEWAKLHRAQDDKDQARADLRAYFLADVDWAAGRSGFSGSVFESRPDADSGARIE